MNISSLLKLATSLFWAVWGMKNVFPLWSSLSLASIIGVVCIYLWLWRSFGKKYSFWQISRTRRLLNLGKVITSSMVIHESSFLLLLLYLLKLDQTFKFSWILLVSTMLSQFSNYVTTYNLNFWIWHLKFGNYGDTYWTHGWFWFLVSQCKLLHLGYEPSLNHFLLLNFNIF